MLRNSPESARVKYALKMPRTPIKTNVAYKGSCLICVIVRLAREDQGRRETVGNLLELDADWNNVEEEMDLWFWNM